jgi:hypothetical protein
LRDTFENFKAVIHRKKAQKDKGGKMGHAGRRRGYNREPGCERRS